MAGYEIGIRVVVSDSLLDGRTVSATAQEAADQAASMMRKAVWDKHLEMRKAAEKA